MSVWKDIRCDANTAPDCADLDCSGPSGFETIPRLRKIAKKRGWEFRTGVGDVCPACAKLPDQPATVEP